MKRTFFLNLVLAPLKTIRETKWGIAIEDIPQTTDDGRQVVEKVCMAFRGQVG